MFILKMRMLLLLNNGRFGSGGEGWLWWLKEMQTPDVMCELLQLEPQRCQERWSAKIFHERKKKKLVLTDVFLSLTRTFPEENSRYKTCWSRLDVIFIQSPRRPDWTQGYFDMKENIWIKAHALTLQKKASSSRYSSFEVLQVPKDKL